MYYTGSVWVLGAIFFFGWGVNGIFPAVHGDDSVGERRCAGTSQPRWACAWARVRCSAACCRRSLAGIRGGSRRPAGAAVDHARARLARGLLALGLRETAPRALALQRANASPAHT